MRLTASSLDRAFRCAWPFRPDVEVPERPPGEAAERGTAIHAERALRVRPPARAEVAYALDPRTGETHEIGQNLGRQYGHLGPDVVAGTADVVTVADDGEQRTVEITDWKTGSPEYVARASENAQLAFLAACAADVEDVNVCIIRLAYVEDVDDTPWLVDEAVLSRSEDLEPFRARLRALVDGLPRAEPSPGDHCRYCPALSICPVTRAVLAEVAPSPPAPALDATAEITGPEHAGAIYVRLRLAEEALAAVRDRVRGYVEQNGFAALPNGRRLRLVPQERETVALSRCPPDLAERLRACGAAKRTTTLSLREVRG